MDIAVVTGAGRGIGEQIARRLAGRGLHVICTDIDEAGAARTAKAVGGTPAALDVRDPDAHRRVAALATERGRLTVWVNNAGVIKPAQVWEHADDDVRLTVEVNLLGVMWGSRAAVDAMRATGGGTILNLASMSAYAPIPGIAVYAATKHAVTAFSAGLHGDLGAAGVPIAVKALCPDIVETPMIEETAHLEETAVTFSALKLLRPEQVADAAMELLDSGAIQRAVPRWRAASVLPLTPFPRAALVVLRAFTAVGEWRRRRFVASR